jgi:hypothetical protein
VSEPVIEIVEEPDAEPRLTLKEAREEIEHLKLRVEDLEDTNAELRKELKQLGNGELLEELAIARRKIFALEQEVEELKPPERCPFVRDDGGRSESGVPRADKGAGDCVARSIAIATGKPYAEVYEGLKAGHARWKKRLRPGSIWHGYEQRRRKEEVEHGCSEKVYAPYLKSLGWKYTDTSDRRVYLRPGALPEGRLIVLVSRHSLALIDGVIHDTHDSGGSGRKGKVRVQGYWSRTQGSEGK